MVNIYIPCNRLVCSTDGQLKSWGRKLQCYVIRSSTPRVKLYEPSPTPCLYVAPAENMLGRVPLIQLFLIENVTPTIPHIYGKQKDSGSPMGCADEAAVDGTGSNVNEVNPLLWQFGRGNLGCLTAASAKRMVAEDDARKKASSVSQGGSSLIRNEVCLEHVRTILQQYIPCIYSIYTNKSHLYKCTGLHTVLEIGLTDMPLCAKKGIMKHLITGLLHHTTKNCHVLGQLHTSIYSHFIISSCISYVHTCTKTGTEYILSTCQLDTFVLVHTWYTRVRTSTNYELFGRGSSRV
jgi:hypothetical protein